MNNKPYIDLSGSKFARWTVLKYAGRSKWLCRCDCGTVKEVDGNHLKSGASKSCGCYGHDALMKRNTTHGDNKTPLHYHWLDIKKRCGNPKFRQYKDYGGRGIYVCDEWATDFTAFRDWSLANGYEKGLSIDRIDNDGPYAPWNCRWTDMATQNNNKRSNHLISANGKTQTVAQWERETGISESVIRSRIKRGWDEQDAVTIPQRTFNNKHSYQMEKARDCYEVPKA